MDNSKSENLTITLIKTYPKLVRLILIALLILVTGLAWKLFIGEAKVPGYYEPIENHKDTSPTRPNDTIAKHTNEDISASNGNVLKENSSKKKLTVKSGDTTVTLENQPANINIGQNNGVIGNNNSNIVINPKPKLTDQQKKELILDVNRALKSNQKDWAGCVSVVVPVFERSPDSEYLREDVKKYLTNEGYNVKEGKVALYQPDLTYKRPIDVKFEEPMDCLIVIVSAPTN